MKYMSYHTAAKWYARLSQTTHGLCDIAKPKDDIEAISQQATRLIT